jgi:hypothetical protein
MLLLPSFRRLQPARQLVDVLAVDRRDERLVHPLDHVVREAVALVLDVLDLLRLPGDLREALHELEQPERALVDVLGRLLEEVEEDLFLGKQSKHAWDSSKGFRGRQWMNVKIL